VVPEQASASLCQALWIVVPPTDVVMFRIYHVASRLRCQVKVRSVGAMVPLGVIGLAAPRRDRHGEVHAAPRSSPRRVPARDPPAIIARAQVLN